MAPPVLANDSAASNIGVPGSAVSQAQPAATPKERQKLSALAVHQSRAPGANTTVLVIGKAARFVPAVSDQPANACAPGPAFHNRIASSGS
jgi:hypothetical protein